MMNTNLPIARSTPSIFLSKLNNAGERTSIRRQSKKTIKIIPEILLIATYPPRECGIASYTFDLKQALDKLYHGSLNVKICAVEAKSENQVYTDQDVKLVLNTDCSSSFKEVLKKINGDNHINLVMIQHEFGLFNKNEAAFLDFLYHIEKTVVLAFHTVLPNPYQNLKELVQKMVMLSASVTVMTKNSKKILTESYGISPTKITVIAHGTHLLKHSNREELKRKYGYQNRKVLSTFGFLGPGKNIETTLQALPKIIKKNKEILFLIIGKTHPTLFNFQGDLYKTSLEKIISELNLSNHVKFINKYVPLNELLEYLQLSDCYLFTSKDPNQAVSGTFSYAVSCGCPIISTPIPHAVEVLNINNGMLFDFGDFKQLADKVNSLLSNENILNEMRICGLHSSLTTAWENAAIAHAKVFAENISSSFSIKCSKPNVDLQHLKIMTNTTGIIQFSKLNIPDLESGYTLDDNARALIALCNYYEQNNDENNMSLIIIYLNFVLKCQGNNGLFLNYLDIELKFTEQNYEVNLEDSNGRAIWALGNAYSVLKHSNKKHKELSKKIQNALKLFKPNFDKFSSPRAISFVIKGLCIYSKTSNDLTFTYNIKWGADKLLNLYNLNKDSNWEWFEPYLTYANSVMPEAMLYASEYLKDKEYKSCAKESFEFLLSKIFTNSKINVISNQSWMLKGQEKEIITPGGQQPIDVAYTIIALKYFYSILKDKKYNDKMEIAFQWFLGNNHLNQMIYNHCTGGCHDGLEVNNVNLNQGAESTISYLLARLCFPNG